MRCRAAPFGRGDLLSREARSGDSTLKGPRYPNVKGIWVGSPKMGP